MVIIPTIVTSAVKVKDLMKKLEVYSLANPSENLYFTLLADASASDKQQEGYDKEIVIAGKEEVARLNQNTKQNPWENSNLFTEKECGMKKKNAS